MSHFMPKAKRTPSRAWDSRLLRISGETTLASAQSESSFGTVSGGTAHGIFKTPASALTFDLRTIAATLHPAYAPSSRPWYRELTRVSQAQTDRTRACSDPY